MLLSALLALAPPPAAPAATPASAFTLEQVLSAPYPMDLTAAPSGGAVAWVFDVNGSRNVWVSDPPDYRARAATPYSAISCITRVRICSSTRWCRGPTMVVWIDW